MAENKFDRLEILKEMDSRAKEREKEVADWLSSHQKGFMLSLIANAAHTITMLETGMMETLSAIYGEKMIEAIEQLPDEERRLFYKDLDHIIVAACMQMREDIHKASCGIVEELLAGFKPSESRDGFLVRRIKNMPVDKRNIH